MKKNILKILLSITTVAFLSACTGNEATPNNATQTGVVAGALVGSVVGYNSGSHSGTNAVVGGLLGAAVGGAVGSAVDNSNPAPVNTGGWE